MALSDKISQLRNEAGWSQEQLAERIGVTRQAVAKWESGAGFPDIDNIQKLARVFGVVVDELLDYSSGGMLAAIVEPININDYKSDSKHTQFDMAVLDKCSDADEIVSIYRTPRLKWYEHIFDFFIGKGTLEVARSGETVKQLKGDYAFYLVSKKGRQWIIEVSKQNLTHNLLTKPFTGKRFNLGEHTYHRNYGSGAVLMKK